jgi:hypothetical protein
MSDSDQSRYYRRREKEERAASEKATCPEARRAHAELADRYAEKLAGRSGEAGPDEPGALPPHLVILNRS